LKVRTFLERRAVLATAVLASLPARGPSGDDLGVDELMYLARLRSNLGLPAASVALMRRIRDYLAEDAQARRLVARAAGRLRAVVGDQWHTAEHTIPSLVDEDMRLGRALLLGGLLLTPTELALVLC
jgi:hypothetical protein